MTVPSSHRTVRTVAALYFALFLLQISDLYLEPGKTKKDAKAVGTDRHHSTHMNALHQ